MTATRFLTSDAVADLATPTDYVDAVRDGYRQRGNGAPAQPRSKFFRGDPDGMFTSYAAILPETGAMGGYMYSAGFGATDAWFMTPLFDADSGAPLALLDGASMNPFKTGAAGAVAVDELARADAETLAVIGSGAQARGQLRATATFATSTRSASIRRRPKTARPSRPISMTTSRPRSMRSTRARPPSPARTWSSRRRRPATRSSTVTPLGPGTHVTAMGQYSPDKREVDTRTLERATYVPDLRERATFDSGEFLLAVQEGSVTEDDIHAELGEVVAGEAPGGRATTRSRSSTAVGRVSRPSPRRTCSTSARRARGPRADDRVRAGERGADGE